MTNTRWTYTTSFTLDYHLRTARRNALWCQNYTVHLRRIGYLRQAAIDMIQLSRALSERAVVRRVERETKRLAWQRQRPT